MPLFEATLCVRRPREEVFAFFLDPANLLLISPPDLNLELEDAPPRLAVGVRVTLKAQRWGVPQRVVSEVTAVEPGRLLVDEQRQGPFRRWVHTHVFEDVLGGTKVTDRVEFEPPGGLLGLVVTAEFVERDLRWVFAYREEKLKDRFGALEVG